MSQAKDEEMVPPGDASTVSGASLDTSGAVPFPRNDPEYPQYGAGAWRWPDLSPFEQGYVVALLRSMPPFTDRGREYCVQFHRLAPETLAAIRKDCAVAENDWPGPTYHHGDGAFFWRQRQAGGYPTNFPPLTVSLNDAGKVVFS